ARPYPPQQTNRVIDSDPSRPHLPDDREALPEVAEHEAAAAAVDRGGVRHVDPVGLAVLQTRAERLERGEETGRGRDAPGLQSQETPVWTLLPDKKDCGGAALAERHLDREGAVEPPDTSSGAGDRALGQARAAMTRMDRRQRGPGTCHRRALKSRSRGTVHESRRPR